MSSLNLNVKSNHHNPLDREAIILHEQLALQRIKEHLPEAALAASGSDSGRSRRLIWKRGLSLAAAVVAAFFKPVRPMRQLEPGQAPIEWHELEHARSMRAINML